MEGISGFIKALTVSLIAAISLRLGALSGLLGTFTAAIVLDYITGVAAASYLRELSSRAGLRGIVKKAGSCIVIAVALLADEVVAQSGVQLGTGVRMYGAIAGIVTVWLILNELISILENLAKMNVPLPGFLLAAIKLLKKQTEEREENPKK